MFSKKKKQLEKYLHAITNTVNQPPIPIPLHFTTIPAVAALLLLLLPNP
jgi:hypothetical protein